MSLSASPGVGLHLFPLMPLSPAATPLCSLNQWEDVTPATPKGEGPALILNMIFLFKVREGEEGRGRGKEGRGEGGERRGEGKEGKGQ